MFKNLNNWNDATAFCIFLFLLTILMNNKSNFNTPWSKWESERSKREKKILMLTHFSEKVRTTPVPPTPSAAMSLMCSMNLTFWLPFKRISWYPNVVLKLKRFPKILFYFLIFTAAKETLLLSTAWKCL